jgi:hypothetical protein
LNPTAGVERDADFVRTPARRGLTLALGRQGSVMEDLRELRRKVGELAAALLDGQLDYATFLQELPKEAESASDPQIEELLDLIEHEPAVGGLFGISLLEHQNYRGEMDHLVKALLR